MTIATMPVRERTRCEAPPEDPPPLTPVPAPPLAPAPAPPRPALSAEELVALAVAAGSEDPGVAADLVFAAAEGSRDRLSAACSLLVRRLKLRSDDVEATRALRILERALVRAPYPDGPWRWAHHLSSRRMRTAERRRRRAVRRRRSAPRLTNRAAWRLASPPRRH